MKLIFDGREIEIPERRIRVKELLRKLNLQSQSTLVICNGEVVTEDEYLNPEDEVEIINVISGG